MRKLLISFILSTVVVISLVGPLSADPATLHLDPLGGAISGAPGDTVGWGFTLTNSSTSWISVTSSALTFETNPTLGTYTDFIGLQSGPSPSFALAPSTSWSEAFDGLSQGVGSYAISSSATLFAEDSGQILVSFDEFNGDPTNGGVQTGSASVSAAFTVDVAPGSPVPEPSTLPLAAAIFFVAVAAGCRSRRSEAKLADRAMALIPNARRTQFLMALLLGAGGQLAYAQAKSQDSFPGKSWPRLSSSERAGWSEEKLAAAREYAENDSIHTSAVMIVQGGKVVDQWGDIDKKISSYSVRKSLLSALYGIYSAEGVIDINQTLEQLGIDDSPDPLTKEEKQARVVDLLRARSGVYHVVDFETDSMKKGRPARGSHAPGTYWYYNNWDFNVLGTIFEKKTGLKIGEAFYRRIAKPIGMEDFQPSDVYYFGGPFSIHPAYHFEITARDMARFGLLYLRHGRWNGKQIVPAEWVEKSSHASEMVQTDGADHGGYEYLWWVDYGGVHFPEVSLPGIYSARGNGAHYIFIVPTLDMVIVHRTDNDPPVKDAKTITDYANRSSPASENRTVFGHLVKLILDARTVTQR